MVQCRVEGERASLFTLDAAERGSACSGAATRSRHVNEGDAAKVKNERRRWSNKRKEAGDVGGVGEEGGELCGGG